MRKAFGELMSYKEIRENNVKKKKKKPTQKKERNLIQLISDLMLAQYMDLAA